MRESTSDSEERPPVFKSWNYLYLLVLGNLALLIILFYAFSRAFG
jgi:hypothetical protein